MGSRDPSSPLWVEEPTEPEVHLLFLRHQIEGYLPKEYYLSEPRYNLRAILLLTPQRLRAVSLISAVKHQALSR
jgi:hypothetical protein